MKSGTFGPKKQMKYTNMYLCIYFYKQTQKPYTKILVHILSISTKIGFIEITVRLFSEVFTTRAYDYYGVDYL